MEFGIFRLDLNMILFKMKLDEQSGSGCLPYRPLNKSHVGARGQDGDVPQVDPESRQLLVEVLLFRAAGV